MVSRENIKIRAFEISHYIILRGIMRTGYPQRCSSRTEDVLDVNARAVIHEHVISETNI